MARQDGTWIHLESFATLVPHRCGARSGDIGEITAPIKFTASWRNPAQLQQLQLMKAARALQQLPYLFETIL